MVDNIGLWILLGQASGMFLLTFVIDIVWTWWTKAIQKKKVSQAVVASVFIYLLGGVSILGYTAAPWLLLPACVGAALGTLAGMKWI